MTNGNNEQPDLELYINTVSVLTYPSSFNIGEDYEQECATEG